MSSCSRPNRATARVGLAVALATAAFRIGAVVHAQAPAPPPSAKACAACHGEDGNSRLPNVPSLAGQPEFFVLNQLILMREGVRRIDAMAALVKPLTDDDIQALAQYFASLEPKASSEAIDGSLSARGAGLAERLRCASCHRADFSGQQQMPRLAKQRLDYLVFSMKALRDDKRSGADTVMTAAVVGVSNADLEALAHFVASR